MRKSLFGLDPILVFILIIGFGFRLYGMFWDNGFHLHPDERMLILVADRINFFSNLNPDFFNYGSLPIYLLKGTSQLIDTLFFTHYATYDGMLTVGRSLSVLFDMGTLIMVYKIAQLIFKKSTIALLAGFFYAVAFFPIQNTHFFVVDVFLTFFITATILQVLKYTVNPSYKTLLLISVAFAAALATKITAIIFYPIIILAIIGAYLVSYRKTMRSSFIASLKAVKVVQLIKPLADLILFNIIFVVFHFFFMPYAYISHFQFLNDTLLQIKMNSNPYIFPYTLQYVYTIPYLYYLKNIGLWGLGPMISAFSILGIFLILRNSLRRISTILEHVVTQKHDIQYIAEDIGEKITNLVIKNYLLFIVFVFYAVYFIIIGRSAVKFMRYMLPIYPFLVLLASYGFYKLQHSDIRFKKLLSGASILVIILWTLMFVNIYSFEHTRITATNWILKNIPPQSTIGVEHWDDLLPLQGSQQYQIQTLTLYDQPDNIDKWDQQKDKLESSDYLIIASNRLYVPLTKLSDCNKYTVCYPLTARYYNDLFNGNLNFKKVAEFYVRPTLPFFPFIHINDQSADESFTVYDHPKIMVFKKK